MTEYKKLPGEAAYAIPYLAEVVEWGAREPAKDSKAVSAFLRLHLIKSWDATKKEWDDMLAVPALADYEIIGDWYVYKKDGSINQSGFEQLERALGWNGDWEFFIQDPMEGATRFVVVETELETYEGKTRVRASWLNAASYIPGSQGISRKATADRLREMNITHSAKGMAKEKPPAP